jgi:MazG family protein
MKSSLEGYQAVIDLVQKLRSPDGCPWDREQDLESITPYILEECHELLEAMARKDHAGICEESGDLLFQIIFLAHLENEAGRFGMREILERIHAKMVTRHPHVFGDAAVHDVETVLLNWEIIKAKEFDKKHRTSVLDGVPSAMPALLRAMAIQRKAARVGFDWSEIEDVLAKVEEEIGELREAEAAGDSPAMREEFGDILFALVNLGRKIGIDPEQALTATTEKFIRRFRHVEAEAERTGQALAECTLSTMDGWWEAAKKIEHTNLDQM